MTTITTDDLTTTFPDGEGLFDVLMRAVKSHLDEEFKRGAIKGAEYATVYLGSLNLAMQTGLNFLAQKHKIGLEADILTQQLALAELQVQKATVELAMLTASQAKIPAEIAQIEAQTLLIEQQQANLTAEAANIPKQGLLIDANKDQAIQQTAELITRGLQIAAQTLLVNQQTANAVTEGLVLDAQKEKLQVELDVLLETKLKTAQETSLLLWKTNTEKAQTIEAGTDANSVVGKQKALYGAQTTGFTRDAEQKAAKLLIDSWSTRRATDEATVADGTNKLGDSFVGQAVTKLLEGVGASGV
jgi:hypothetical protein